MRGAWWLSIGCVVVVHSATIADAAAQRPRPNVLWISAEDISPDLGCYGDPYAITPRLDRFAAEGVRYTRCFTHAGVCAPSRSGLITGRFPPSIGTHHMRCQGVPPDDVRCFPQDLRAAGYYCTNNVKTDYQFEPPASAWDANSNTADWRGRAPGQPFFCVINLATTHESQIREPSAATQRLVAALPAELRHDPAKAIVPPVYPDTPITRRDLANYADNLTALDRQVGEILERLAADGLAEETIVWFWGDHGRGLPRYKRWLYDTGTRVPLIIRVPEKLREWAAPGAAAKLAPGSVNDELVAFLDFAPTMLSLTGVPVPESLHGQAFLGPQRATVPRDYVYGHRDRMDETYDLIRMVRDQRFKYLRNFRHDLSYSQSIWYMDQMPTMRDWRELHAAGNLTAGPALHFRATKPVEELFDTEADPYELHNLADDPRYADDLTRLRAALRDWMLRTGDVGLIPEPLLDERQRPAAAWSTAAMPRLRTETTNDGQVVALLSPQHPADSVVFTLLPRDSKPGKGTRWELAAGPILLKSDQWTLFAKCCRIGFHESPLVVWNHGDPVPVPTTDKPRPPHWSTDPQLPDLLAKLWDLKAFDGRTDPEAWAAYQTALDDPEPALRYWGFLGATRFAASTKPATDPAAWEARIEHLFASDPAPVIRILAAEQLVRRKQSPVALESLGTQLAEQPGRHASLRLQAITAIRDLGDLGRPLLPQVRTQVDGGEYVGRIARDLVAHWE